MASTLCATATLRARVTTAYGKKEKRARRVKPVLEPVSADGDSKFARALGSTDYQTREKGLQALTLWMCARVDITEAEMLKIWKGLFFCFWHSDQAPVQARSTLVYFASDQFVIVQLWATVGPSR